jgi:hypothetical protein
LFHCLWWTAASLRPTGRNRDCWRAAVDDNNNNGKTTVVDVGVVGGRLTSLDASEVNFTPNLSGEIISTAVRNSTLNAYVRRDRIFAIGRSR